jgi:hypothetical protein
MLTKAQLEEIERIIRQRMLALSYEALGERALTEDEIAELKRVGLIRENVRHLTADPYTIGKVIALTDRDTARTLGFGEIMSMAKEIKVPPTAVEKKAMEYAEEHAGQYIKGITDDMVKEVRVAATRVGRTALDAIRTEVASTLKNRETTSQLRTALYHAIDDRARDWKRVASTEINDAIQRGIFGEIVENHGSEALVFKRPNPDACNHCKRVYLEADGITPKVFVISDLEDSNYGEKAADWGPTIGAVHPYCQCQLHIIPKGSDFVKRRVDHKGKIITDEEYEAMGEEDKKTTRHSAILEHTGETAAPTTAKSLTLSELSDMDGDCICAY